MEGLLCTHLPCSLCCQQLSSGILRILLLVCQDAACVLEPLGTFGS
jgi:hypothetical protein